MNRLYNRVNKLELKEQLQQSIEKRTTLSFYKYIHLTNARDLRDQLFLDLSNLKVFGRIYVSQEGINAQISLPSQNLEALKFYLENTGILSGIRLNIAIEDDGKSFYKLTIKVRDKIVADGLKSWEVDLSERGIHVSPEEFNQMADDPDTILVDMRNHYESEVGHFQGAILPDVETFKEALPQVSAMLDEKKAHNILMYCTGGIRCEKASAYLKKNGFQNVFQLDGGIIEYTRQIKTKGLPNKFVGKNFVFDERLGERVNNTIISVCHQCGASCDEHVNCANDACHLLFIQCPGCREKFQGCCSKTCQDFKRLPEEEQKAERKHLVFNGTKFGKGRYKAHRNKKPLILY